MANKRIVITMSFEIHTNIRDDQTPEDIIRMYAGAYLFKNPKLIKVDVVDSWITIEDNNDQRAIKHRIINQYIKKCWKVFSKELYANYYRKKDFEVVDE